MTDADLPRYAHELAHAIAVARYQALITRGPDFLATEPFHAVDDPAPSQTELLALMLAGPAFDFLASGGTDIGAFTAGLFEEAATCEAREDCARAIGMMCSLSPEQIAQAVTQAERAAKAAFAVYRLNPTGVASFASAIESCSPGFGIVVTEAELIDLVELRVPMWRVFPDFD